MTFNGLGINAELVKALASRNIKEPSEIQRLVIPALLDTDLPGSAENSTASLDSPHLLFGSPTGTGKTLAYLLPLIQKTAAATQGAAATEDSAAAGGSAGSRPSWPKILVLAPTYELASQIKSEFDTVLAAAYGDSAPRAVLLIGSSPMNRQIDSLKKHKPLAVVGNPARVSQLARMKKLSFRALCYLVLDEGDRLMADELFPETAELCRPAFPADGKGRGERRIIACSATFSEKNRERLFSLSPDTRWKIIAQEENDILRKNIEHWAFFAEEREKLPLLCSFVAAIRPAKALVFTSRAGQVGRIVSRLQYRHLAAAGLWGDMDKKDRKAAIDGFRKGNIRILVSSDLAARGLDIDRISHIIALDIPDGEETYIHRAGRTARAGKRGVMASFGGEVELRRLAKIEKKLGIAVFPKELYGGRLRVPGGDDQ
ncbi:MAG: DEAD/DEAH box helicase [Treponema sp.]|jgi:superfamily II DNA/RNA helicase|nr:DEAD/DEAH box helicase [Treponema sp.]